MAHTLRALAAGAAALLLMLTPDDGRSQNQPRRGAQRFARPGEIVTPPALAERPEETLHLGDAAPDFTLPTAAEESKSVTLSSFRGKKPVVLVFGSISCPPFRRQLESVDALSRQYRDRAEFYMVYVREAHPDSTILVRPQPGAEEVLRVFPQTDNATARREHARLCTNTFRLTMPLLIDGPDNAVNKAYAGWPIRLAVVDVHGKLVYYGGPGPRGFKPAELRDWLQKNLGEQLETTTNPSSAAVP